MCLSTVTWQSKSMSNTRSKDKWQKGYKVFEVAKDFIGFPFKPIKSNYEVHINKTYKADNKLKIHTHTSDQYYAGFHIFPAAIAAKLYTPLQLDANRMLFEVEYRKVSAIGTHEVHTKYPVDCIIAQEIRIIRPLTYDEVQKLQDNEQKVFRTDRDRKRRRRY